MHIEILEVSEDLLVRTFSKEELIIFKETDFVYINFLFRFLCGLVTFSSLTIFSNMILRLIIFLLFLVRGVAFVVWCLDTDQV